ncbi:MAG: TlpA family protein disulfide reductase [Myxococcales bacterium]|nr:TlpA family protein disulfide reductase [Myxococcales bacterium]
MNRREGAASLGPMRVLGLFVVAGTLLCCLGFPSGAHALSTGERAPEIGLQDLDGKVVKMADLRGKVVLIDFWATWCKPCKAELPVLQKLQKKYGSDLVVVAVSVDRDPSKVRAFLKELGVSVRAVVDAEHRVAGRYAPPKMPSSYIADGKGIIKFVHEGFKAADAATFDREIKSLIAK